MVRITKSMNFTDGELVEVSWIGHKARIENGVFTMAGESSTRKQLAIVVSGHNLSKDDQTVEYVPVGRCEVPQAKRNLTLLQLDDPGLGPLAVECGLVTTSPRAAIEKLNRSITESNLQRIKQCVKRFLEGDL